MEPGIYNCMVVDDEPIARKIILGYIQQLPFLALEKECINALSAIEYLRTSHTIDILFLDINMPHLTGLQLLKIIPLQLPVILTTAYTEYAVESYELNAVDYLLKPFSFERFTKGVYKALNLRNKPYRATDVVTEATQPSLFIKSDGKNYPVLIDAILYCEARKNYTLVVLSNGQKLIPLVSLSRFEGLLTEAGGDFIQVHRSFLIAKKHITAVTAATVQIQDHEIPIGIQFKERFFSTIGMKDGNREG
jgi:DNA-binding LytR/AlgR family response regulator